MLKKKLLLLTLVIYIGSFFITFFSPQEVKAYSSPELFQSFVNSYPEIKDRCYDEDGSSTRADADSKYAISGKINFDLSGLDAADKQKIEDDVIDGLNIFLFKPGDYWGQGEGKPYCKDVLNKNGEFRFDLVYPGTYQLIVYDSRKDRMSSFKTTVCDASGWFFSALIQLPFIKQVANGLCNAALQPEEFAFMGAATVNKPKADPKNPQHIGLNLDGSSPDKPALVVRVVQRASWSGVFMDVLTMFDGALTGIANGVAKQINGGLIIIENLTKKDVVVSAWGKVRDASNALLIIGLLIIALANVFRFQIDVYTARALLPRLLIAGIMINFSLLLTQLIIDASNVLTLFLGEEIYFHSILPLNSAGFNMFSAIGLTVGGFLFFLFWGFILLVAFIAALTVLAILVIRIALLWVLAIFSPLIFLFGVLPFTRGLNSMWWKYLIQYAFMGPVMALLLLVASKL